MEENQIIAEFMDEEITLNGATHDLDEFDGLKYHSSWDWLMPVVEKVISKDYEFMVFEELKFQLWRVDIDAVYKAVVEFIKQLKPE